MWVAWMEQGEEGRWVLNQGFRALRSLTAETPVVSPAAMVHLACRQRQCKDQLGYHSAQGSHKRPTITLPGIDVSLQTLVGPVLGLQTTARSGPYTSPISSEFPGAEGSGGSDFVS